MVMPVSLPVIVLKSGDEIRLVYIQDKDKDGLSRREEFLYGTSDEADDTDQDGISDFDEVRTGWVLDTVVLPEPIKVYSDPTEPDVDSDGLTDDQEKAKGIFTKTIFLSSKSSTG